jgi:tuftelin-interacting protein 11
LDKDQDIPMADANPSDEDAEDEDGEDDGSQGEDVAEVQDDSDYSESSRLPSPRVRLRDENDYGEDENEDPKPRTGGLGFKSAALESDDTSMSFGAGVGGRGGIGARGGIGTGAGIGARGGIGTGAGIGARGGIGTGAGIGARRGIGVTLDESAGERVPRPSSSKGSIGAAKSLASAFGSSPSILKTVSLSEHESSASASPAPVPVIHNQDLSSSSRSSPPPALDGMPTSFGRPQEKSQRFQPKAATPTPKPANLTAHEAAHFSKISGTFGARMLSKMGWQAGVGLGVTGGGIVTPIESKLRPQKMGIAFKGFREKTEQSKREAKRRGEEVSDEEDEKTKKMRRKVKEAEQKRSDVWKKPKKVKTKIEHKTYEQIISEAGQEPAAVGLGQIIDATGAVVRMLSSVYC